MIDFTPGEVVALFDDPVPVGTSVAGNLKHAAFAGEILCCRRSEGRYQANIQIQDCDELGFRRTPRFSVRLAAEVFTRHAPGPLPATIVDISGAGLGLELPVATSVGDAIAVESEMNVALGEVRHSRQSAEHIYRVGVALHHVMQKPIVSRNAGEARKVISKPSALAATLKTFANRFALSSRK